MNRSSILSGHFPGLIFIIIFIFNTGGSFAQSVSWVRSFGNSTYMAEEKNKLILADFWAIWCVPCLKTDQQVWMNDTILSLSEKFVCMRFDVSNGWQHSEPFFIDRIPTIKILDCRGEVLFTKEGYDDPSEMKEILSSFPADVGELYSGLDKYRKDNKNHIHLLDVAIAYQNCALKSKSPAIEIFVKESNQTYKKAKSACKKQKDYSTMARIDLLMSLNGIISGQPEKGTEEVLELLEDIGEENLSLAYYVLVRGFLGQANKDLAGQYYEKLKVSSGAEEYLKLLGFEFE